MLYLLTFQGTKTPAGEQNGILFGTLKAGVEKSQRDQREGTVVAAVSFPCDQGRGTAVSALHTVGISALEASKFCIGFAGRLAAEN